MAIRQIARMIFLVSLALSASGCACGLLYTSMRQPLVTNMRNTPRGTSEAEHGTRMLSLPVTAVSIAVAWNSRAIGDIAKQVGLSEIYYADLYTFSLLLGIWKQQTVTVYGKAARAVSEKGTGTGKR